ncbi:CgeB family protein [Vibrio caribbeanicus]|uniref:CgeB family protein n=1 Tax=Vibrio caribbeanicus TaxID=701175 RepID=UPI0030D856EE
MINKKKLLFVSNTSSEKINHILDAFLNKSDLIVKTEYLWVGERISTFITKVFEKLKIPLDTDRLNKRVLDAVENFKPDIVFIVKGNNIYPSTLKTIRKNDNIKLISWSQDDMYAKHNRSIYYTKGIGYYDLVVTQKSYNVKELMNIGAKSVLFQNKAYSKKWHKPYSGAEQKTDVLFIGHAEKIRFEELSYLAENGIKIDVFGSGWNSKEYKHHHNNLNITSAYLEGEQYARAIASSKISLCFLRKVNRDLQTSRSIEIPACGGFMLAERTDEHKVLFEEGEEAVYFGDKVELLDKINYFLEHEGERLTVAKNGRNRVLASDYSYDARIEHILETIYES